MELKQHLSSLPRADREQLAKSCNTTVGHLQNVAYGYRAPSVELCVLLEQQTQGVIKRQELVENWQKFWPELATATKQGA